MRLWTAFERLAYRLLPPLAEGDRGVIRGLAVGLYDVWIIDIRDRPQKTSAAQSPPQCAPDSEAPRFA